jgi:hypothetical protein
MRILTALFLVSLAWPQPKPPSCGSTENHQFDFWLGEWDVQVGGQKIAQSSITSLMGGCIVLEHWKPFGGGEGKSWNFYNRATEKWEQLWITDSGDVLKVAGGLKDGAMREEGAKRLFDGRPGIHRHCFTPVAPDRVRQFCEESSDGGKTWYTVFDGLYIPAKPQH